MSGAARTVLVTGASRGIGAAIRERLLADGHRVIGVSRSPGPAAARYIPVHCDLTELDAIAGTLGAVCDAHPDLDALISNAGIPSFGNLEELSPGTIQRHIELNLTSHLLVTRALVPRLKLRGGGDVVLMGSEAALRGGRRGSIYCAAKFGLRGFAQALRQECAASNVRVCIVHPGMVRTGFFDPLDFAPGDDPANAIEPPEVAAAVALILDAHPGTVIEEVTLSPLKKVVQARPAGEEAP